MAAFRPSRSASSTPAACATATSTWTSQGRVRPACARLTPPAASCTACSATSSRRCRESERDPRAAARYVRGGLAGALAGLPPRPRRRESTTRPRCASSRNFARSFDLEARPFMVEPYFQVEVEPGVTAVRPPGPPRRGAGRHAAHHRLQDRHAAGGDRPEAARLLRYTGRRRSCERTVSKASFWYLDDGTDLDDGASPTKTSAAPAKSCWPPRRDGET